MLPRNARLTSPEEFARTTKSGFRQSSTSLVAYLYLTEKTEPARCGLIVSKNVGGSVVRHRIARQLRHGLLEHITQLPTGALIVIRALPTATAKEVRQELDLALPKLITKSLAKK
ncbi:unannotated protein [freshwater metagenome]|uniref:Unannotated protein n=1 Tax=freshwater metagenome TaxID=449393 RepID=A0A6J7LKQ6_9ZZZZ|nr:ribonuclease P protein component [Actinomycetota bacterium]MSX28385.1 ribonuclease P protein component [Actinomycetota bacterium]MSY03670.1 ribonuclease P protein component [Actinomycetota bacterium]MSY20186.1 ribonuclease P protein component [Actinomycetota bacterium]